MADETAGGVTAGDRVTFVDTNGQRYEAVCSTVHGPRTIDVLYDADGDGAFGGFGGEYVEATGVTAAEDDGEAYAYVEGGWSA